jgi:hypothetical protein
MSQPEKKMKVVNKDLLGMFGLSIKPTPLKRSEPVVKTKIEVQVPTVIKPILPAEPKPIPASSESIRRIPPLDALYPTPAAVKIDPAPIKKSISPKIYRNKYFGVYICRNCGRDFNGNPIVSNGDPQRNEKWDILLCPLCGEYGLNRTNKESLEDEYKWLEKNYKGFIRNNSNVKPISGDKNDKG